ncbi:hypothetical protein CLOBL_34180 [Clostridium sp. BL-8]|nr:hypothetical protein CLOBL_34180 [Clostridium sp. BL-8]
MIFFIKSHALTNLRNKLLILYILNVTDIIFTFFLLNTGFYMEANALMSNTVKSYIASFFLKILLPAILFIILFFRMKKATDKQLMLSNIFITGAVILYILINISHIVWIAILPIFIFS